MSEEMFIPEADEDEKPTTVRISRDDKNFCKEHSLKFSELLRESISRHKELDSEGTLENTLEKERNAHEAFKLMFYKLRDFVEAKGLLDEYMQTRGFQ
jgi:hypothetical protein